MAVDGNKFMGFRIKWSIDSGFIGQFNQKWFTQGCKSLFTQVI